MNRFYISEGTFHKYEKETGKLRLSGGSWTINLDKIDLESIKSIRYITERYIYEIHSDDAKSNGYIRDFRGENKLVVPIKYWKIKEK